MTLEPTAHPILVVEDDSGTARLQARALERAGFSVRIAHSASSAMEILKGEPIRLVVLDFHLHTEKNGLDLYARMKEAGYEVPVIMVTGVSSESTVIQAIRAGARDFVSKSPDYLEYLPEAVRRVLRQVGTERRLMESEARLAGIIASAHDAVITIEEDQSITLFNSAAERMFGCSAEEAMGQSLQRFIPHATECEHGTALTSCLRAAGQGRRANGELFPLEASVSRSEGPGQVLRTLAIRDITDRKHAEQQIREQAALLNVANDAICVIDLEGRIRFWNQGATRLYGYTPEQAQGRSMTQLVGGSSSEYTTARESVLRDGEWHGELEQGTKVGKRILVDSRWTLMRDEDRTPQRILVINSDVTERKKQEAEMLRQQRIESIGFLTGGIAHDLNNVLTPILMATELLKTVVPEDACDELLEPIRASAERGAELVRQILSFTRGTDDPSGDLCLDLIVRDVIKILNRTFPKCIEIRSHIEKDLKHVAGDPTQLYQVLINLCVNARDAMPEGGTLILKLENYSPDRDRGSFVRLTVEDTGDGIAPEIKDKIFDPYFTTKEVGKGTGLGLPTVLNIVKQHNGYLTAENREGAGARFEVHLPATGQALSTRQHSLHFRLPRGNGETILVVDDEISICEMIKATLEAHGYQVMTANDGAEAVALYAQHHGSIGVVLTDIMMPIMDGIATIRALTKMNPSLRIIAFTAMAPEGTDQQLRELGVHARIQKPFSASTLLTTLEVELGKAKPADREEIAGSGPEAGFLHL